MQFDIAEFGVMRCGNVIYRSCVVGCLDEGALRAIAGYFVDPELSEDEAERRSVAVIRAKCDQSIRALDDFAGLLQKYAS